MPKTFHHLPPASATTIIFMAQILKKPYFLRMESLLADSFRDNLSASLASLQLRFGGTVLCTCILRRQLGRPRWPSPPLARQPVFIPTRGQ